MALLAQSLKRCLLETRYALPPTFLLPFRASITTVSQTLETRNIPEPLLQSGQHVSSDLEEKLKTSAADAAANSSAPSSKTKTGPYAREDKVATSITPSIQRLLPLLHSQPSHYITAHLHGHPYLLTRGDTVRLPFLMPKVQPGDILRLNRATHIGSRDYTLKAPEPTKGTRDVPKKIHYLDDRLFVCRARVIGVESEPMRVMKKTKRRQRYVRHVFSKHKFTVIKISDLDVRSLEDYQKRVKGGKAGPDLN
ncbi:hypothetical protein BCR34DRAFT_494741 [Clohesyomyces aquaticus]|uniref:Large ribosomal subunit protein bL21m n=1 Tax=Clohesyomyces aquaticus TaxID=1231657 RepID=A0A1Y1YQF4_9PLEO|nr:hypothetical protein BCR34DRAFT_494741 [Clohesyomyces aquaticus]